MTRPELLVLTALAFLSRCWSLFYPRVVVWDEVHFERFAAAYSSGRYYIDVHPPLGKLLLAGAARLLGVSAAALAANEPTPMLRVLPAVAGALIIPVVYLILRELGAGRRVATLAAALLLVDNALLVESRLILTDSMLVLFGMIALLFYLTARRRNGGSRWAFLVASAVAAGMAASIKWTGLSALGLILLAWSAEALLRRRGAWALLREGAVFVSVPLAIYAGSFALHFALLDRSGPSDKWMSPRFQTTLQGNPAYVSGASEPFLRSFVELNRTMSAINTGWATDTNTGASPWYTWPIAKHSMGFWSPTTPGQEPERWIVLFANPIVWWGALFGMLAVALAAMLRRAELERYRMALLFLAAGYALNFVPFAFIKRPMYLYHYFFALLFSTMIAAIGVGALAGWAESDDARPWSFPTKRSARFYFGIVALAAATFAYLAPMSYGWPLSAESVVHRRWLIERHF